MNDHTYLSDMWKFQYGTVLPWQQDCSVTITPSIDKTDSSPSSSNENNTVAIALGIVLPLLVLIAMGGGLYLWFR